VATIGIAGAGLLGRLLAWQLGGLGHDVTVYDPASGPGPDEAGPARAAGWTAAGMLSPWAELECAHPHLALLGLRSLALWPELLRALPQPVHFRRNGSLLLAHQGDIGTAARVLEQLRTKMPEHEAPRPLSPQQLGALEPAVHGPAHAWLLEGEGQIHTVQAMQALAACATERGVHWCWQRPVQTVAPGRIEQQAFDWVFDVRGVGARGTVDAVDATGPDGAPGMPRVGGVGGVGGVRGVRGEMVWLHVPGMPLNRPLRLLHPRWRVYLVPRPDALVLVGASEIESEDRSPVSVRSLIGLLSAAHSVMPDLAEARLVHTEANLRPALPDNLPAVVQQPGLTRINGLFRHGWLIAPALVQDALNAGLLQRRPVRESPAAPSSSALRHEGGTRP
jgi:glycine oxidase